MKQVLSACNILILATAFTVVSVHSQSIQFESKAGELMVNNKIIDSSQIPDRLSVGDLSFSLHSMGPFPMRVEINGNQYEIWKNRITEAKEDGAIDFRVLVTLDEPSIEIESFSTPNDLYGFGGALVGNMVDMVSSLPWPEMIDSLISPDGHWQQLIMNSADVVADPSDFAATQTESIPYGMASTHHDATKMIELSNYMSSVRDAGGELFELLRHEWREELEAVKMAQSIRKLEDGVERDRAIDELEAKLKEVFDMKQENRRIEIKHLRMELKRMEDRLRERSRAKDRLIDARLDELLGKVH